MDKIIFKNKRILFYGPAVTNDKKELNVNNYDYIVITNNMINIFFKKVNKHNITCKIIHLTNYLYTRTYIDRIKEHCDAIDIFITVHKHAEKLLKEILKNKNHTQVYNLELEKHQPKVNRTPLGLSRILCFFDNTSFEELYITGVTFYKNSNDIKDCYEKNYICKEGLIYNIYGKDKHIHDINSNIKYTQYVCKNNPKIKMCKELNNILTTINL
jgi:hypothetical protein